MVVTQLKDVETMLKQQSILYVKFEHEPVYTSREAARVRNVQLKTGVKALVLKTTDSRFVLGLVAADRKMRLQKLAKIVGTRKLTLASPKEVLETTGCEVGAVHPFGNIYRLPTYLDKSVRKSKTVNFNAGLHTISIQMKAEDLIRLVKPVEGDFSQK